MARAMILPHGSGNSTFSKEVLNTIAATMPATVEKKSLGAEMAKPRKSGGDLV
jgi:hypothetical protein